MKGKGERELKFLVALIAIELGILISAVFWIIGYLAEDTRENDGSDRG